MRAGARRHMADAIKTTRRISELIGGSASERSGDDSYEQLRSARHAALNLLEDAVSAKRRADELIEELRAEVESRGRAEEALRLSEEKYRTLFDSMDEGYCIIQMIYDEAGRAVDWRFLQVNRAFSENNGLHEAEGKTIREMAPDIEPKWFGIYDRVAVTGEPVRFEEDSPALGRVFSLYAFRIGQPDERKVAVIFTDITERKRAEESLRLSEERQSFLLRLSDALRTLTDPLEIKRTAAHMLAEKLRVNRVFYADVQDDAWQVVRCFEDGVTAMPDGPYPAALYGRWIMDTYRAGQNLTFADSRTDPRFSPEESRAHVEIDLIAAVGIPLVKGGELVAILAVHCAGPRGWTAQEISLVEETAERTWGAVERTHAEAAARESDLRLRIAAEAAGLSVWEWNLETNCVRGNEQHFRLMGMEPQTDGVEAGEFFRRVHADDRVRLEEEIRRSVREERVFDAVYRVVYDSGEMRWMAGYGRLTERGGGSLFVSGVMRDITDRMRLEDDLRESGERMRLLIESATDVSIFTTDRRGLVNSWNTGSQRIYGYSEDEIVGRDVAILFTTEDRERGAPEAERTTALEHGRALDERWHLRKDGSTFFASGLTQPLGEDGSHGFVKIARDMTDQMRAERAQREKELIETLVHAQELERKRIARDLHDELGQQLTALRLKLDRVGQDAPEPLAAQIDEVKRIARSIDEGVDFLAWELRPAALDDLGLIPALEKYIKEWSVYTHIPADFAAPTVPHRCEPAVETALYRVVQEALNNVHKHAAAKNAQVTIRLRDGMIVLTVDDDGEGFDPEETAARSRGIGLIGMRERVQLIGGTLEVESEIGRGTTLYVKAPARTVH